MADYTWRWVYRWHRFLYIRIDIKFIPKQTKNFCSQLKEYIWVQKNWKSFRHKLFLHLFISSCNVTNVSTLKTIGSKWIRTCLKNKHPWNSYNKIHQKIIVVTAKSHEMACTSFSFNFLPCTPSTIMVRKLAYYVFWCGWQ